MSKRRSTNDGEQFLDGSQEYIDPNNQPEHIYAEAESLTSNTEANQDNIVYVDPQGNVIKPERVLIVKGNTYNESISNSPNGMSSPGPMQSWPTHGRSHTNRPHPYS